MPDTPDLIRGPASRRRPGESREQQEAGHPRLSRTPIRNSPIVTSEERWYFILRDCDPDGEFEMAEDLLDYWVRLIKTILPANAWIHSRLSNDDYLIQIAWAFQDDSAIPPKHSPKIEIIIKERSIEGYLDKDKKDREASDVVLKEFICEQYNHFLSDSASHATQHTSARKVVNL